MYISPFITYKLESEGLIKNEDFVNGMRCEVDDFDFEHQKSSNHPEIVTLFEEQLYMI